MGTDEGRQYRMAEKTRVTATVRLVIELDEGTWGPDCKLEQVYKQAKQGAIGQLENAFKDRVKNVRLLSAEVTAVLVTEK
jgi:hypothetical protein